MSNKLKELIAQEGVIVSLKALRRAKGFSQEGLAAKCGIARSTLYRLEQGLDNPTLATMAAIAHQLDVSVGTIADAIFTYYGK